MLKKLLILLFAIAGGTLVYSTQASAVANAVIDCAVDQNGAGTNAEVEIYVEVAAPVSYQVDVTGCDYVCGAGDSTVDTGSCGSANFVGGGPVSVNFTGYGWLQAYLPATYVAERYYVIPDEVDIAFSGEAGDGNVIFTWNAFSAGYIFTIEDEVANKWCSSTVNDATGTCTISGLENGREYNFTLKVDFQDGTGGDYVYGTLSVTPQADTTTTSAPTTTTAPTTTLVDDTLVPTGSTTGSSTWLGFILIALGLTAIAFRQRKTN